ncbi:MAG TPA: sulfatase-like hydrolase/transferase, partial [Polyangiaceae bacterium]|nr:sulfatase-like hydrolase/transferase [Polyangiaceae bacterium]
DRSFALLGGAANNHFTHETAASRTYVLDGNYSGVDSAGHPAEGAYSTDFYTDKLIGFIDDGLGSAPDKPFFAYAAYTSPHWPLQVPDAWLDKYKGKYDKGYDPIIAERIRRLKDRGILPQSLTPTPGFEEWPNRVTPSANNGTAAAVYSTPLRSAAEGGVDYGPGNWVKNWETLTELEKKSQARYMELYAAMVDHLDYSVGRLIQHLKDIGEYEYTFIVFHSDSGADGYPITPTQDPIVRDELNAAEPVFSSLGKDSSQSIKYGIRWAEVSNTPLSQLKGFQGQGGLTAPAIVHLPGQTESLPAIHHFTHITDDTATFLELAGATPPSEPAPPLIEDGVDKNADKVVYDGRYVYPVTGVSFLSAVQEENPGPTHTSSFGGETYGRAFILSADGRWRARWTEPPWGPVDGHWELFDVQNDRAETKDLSAVYPQRLAGLVDEWKAYVAKYGVRVPVRPRSFW